MLLFSPQVMLHSLQPHELQPARLLCPWDFTGKNTGVGCHFLLQGIFPTQGSNLGLLHCRQILYRLSYERNLGVILNSTLFLNQTLLFMPSNLWFPHFLLYSYFIPTCQEPQHINYFNSILTSILAFRFFFFLSPTFPHEMQG